VIRTGNSAGKVKTGQIYTVSSISFSDSINASIFRINGDEIYSYTEDGFELAPSALPTDRPLTYDETQMLKKGDVVALGMGMRKTTVLKVSEDGIFEKNSNFPWAIDKNRKSTCGDIYFVSHGKEESKEEKKEEVKADKTAQEAYGVDFADIYTIAETKIKEKPVLKSVSQILYGRR
jgi:hypothetical protein